MAGVLYDSKAAHISYPFSLFLLVLFQISMRSVRNPIRPKFYFEFCHDTVRWERSLDIEFTDGHDEQIGQLKMKESSTGRVSEIKIKMKVK